MCREEDDNSIQQMIDAIENIVNGESEPIGIYEASQYPQQDANIAKQNSKNQQKESPKPVSPGNNPAPTPGDIGIPEPGAPYPNGPFGPDEAPTEEDRPDYSNNILGTIVDAINNTLEDIGNSFPKPNSSPSLPGGGGAPFFGGGGIPVPVF
jgi:hypothetical protein